MTDKLLYKSALLVFEITLSRITRLFLLPALTILSTQIPAQKLPEKTQLLATMTTANEYFMAKWPDTGKEIVTNKTRPSHIWTRAVYYEGLMALYNVDPQKRYYDYAVDWGEKHQ